MPVVNLVDPTHVASWNTRAAAAAPSLPTQPAREEVREALQDLYDFCKDLNDFRPDSRLGRKVRAALAQSPKAQEPSDGM